MFQQPFASRSYLRVSAIAAAAVVATGCAGEVRTPTAQRITSNATMSAAPSPTATDDGIESLNLPDEYRGAFNQLDNEGRAALVALHREGKTELLRAALDQAELENLWATANRYALPREGFSNPRYNRALKEAFIQSRPKYVKQLPLYIECLKPFGVEGKSNNELFNSYTYRGAAKIPRDMSNEDRQKLEDKAHNAARACGSHLTDAQLQGEGALRNASFTLPSGAQKTEPDGLNGPGGPTRSVIPECRKDPHGVVYYGGIPENPTSDSLRTAALRADVKHLTSILKKRPQDFTNPKNAWIVTMLASTGCTEALDVVFNSQMPVVARERFGEGATHWERHPWEEIGLFASVNTFDKFVGRAIDQKTPRNKLIAAVDEGLCDYPASFASVLAKHGILAAADNKQTPEGTVPLWQSAVDCANLDFVKAFLSAAGDNKPAAALAYAVHSACQKIDGVDPEKRAQEDVAKIRTLRQIGYNPHEKVTFPSRDQKSIHTSATELAKASTCPKAVKEVVASAEKP